MLRVLLVDDSKLMRAATREALEGIADVTVVAEADNGEDAISRVILDRPDLVVMDIEMPRLDGLSVLRELRDRGLLVPVLMLSSLTQDGARATFQALELGALDFVPKPAPGTGVTAEDAARRLITRVTELAEAHREMGPVAVLRRPSRAPDREGHASQEGPAQAPLQPRPDCRLLVLGASTGGPNVLSKIFSLLKQPLPLPMLVVQHMPPLFTAAFAQRLDQLGPTRVSEASERTTLKPGTALVAPGDKHLVVEADGTSVVVDLNDGPRQNGHRPSVDVTLLSAVRALAGNVAGVLMTGMGRDGATGMVALRRAGGPTIAQDEQSSAIYGMNRRAIEEGGAQWVLPVEEIAAALHTLFPPAPSPK